MRSGALALVLALIVLLLSASQPGLALTPHNGVKAQIRAPVAELTPNHDVTVNYTRTLVISQYLYVSLIDRIEIYSNDPEPFGAIVIYYKPETLNLLKDIEVLGGSDSKNLRELEFSKADRVLKGLVGITVYLKSWVVKDQSYVIEIRARIVGSLKLYLDDVSKDIIYNFTFPEFWPKFPTNISKFELRVKYPDDGTVQIDQVKPEEGRSHDPAKKIIKWAFQDIERVDLLNRTEYQIIVPFKRTSPPTEILSLERDVYVRISGKVKVVDKITVATSTPAGVEQKYKLSSITLGLAKEVSNIRVWDEFGKLDFTRRLADDDTTFVTVNFRTELMGTQVYTFWISFELLANSSAVIENKTGFYISIPIAPKINATFGYFSLTIHTPYIIQVKGDTEKLDFYRGEEFAPYGLLIYQVYRYQKTEFVPFHNEDIYLKPLVSPTPYVPLFLVIFVVSLAAIAIASKIASIIGERKRRVEAEKLPEICAIAEKLEAHMKVLEEYVVAEEEFYVVLYEKALSKPTIRTLELLRGKLRNLRKLERAARTLPDELRAVPEVRMAIDKIARYQAEIDIVRERILRNIEAFLRSTLGKKRMFAENESYLEILRDRLSKIKREINNLKELMLAKYTY